MKIYRTAFYQRRVKKIFSESELEDIEAQLIENPEGGDVIPGTGGIRKIRVRASGRGKRGGARVIYFFR